MSNIIDEVKEDIEHAESAAKPPYPHKKRLLIIAKIAFTILLFYLIFRKIDFAVLAEQLKSIPIIYIILSIAALNLSQVVSAYRIRYYFRCENYNLQWFYSISLYYVGMFFNLILPGGISGDGYKAYMLKKQKDIPVITSIRLMLSERANGLCMLLFMAILFFWFGNAVENIEYARILLVIAIIGLFPSYFICVKIFLKEKPKTAAGALWYSLWVQATTVWAGYFLFKGIGVESGMLDYMGVFMLACIVAILPFSIGGAGLREATFLYSAGYIGIQAEVGVAVMLAFFGVYAVTSLTGILFLGAVKKYAKNPSM